MKTIQITHQNILFHITKIFLLKMLSKQNLAFCFLYLAKNLMLFIIFQQPHLYGI